MIGLDLSKPLDAGDFVRIRHARLDHHARVLQDRDAAAVAVRTPFHGVQIERALAGAIFGGANAPLSRQLESAGAKLNREVQRVPRPVQHVAGHDQNDVLGACRQRDGFAGRRACLAGRRSATGDCPVSASATSGLTHNRPITGTTQWQATSPDTEHRQRPLVYSCQ
ncbi:hypothetical protein [Burkholderia sp. lig30]|uniref:hypothetical protein n=1 Tax=Burkholderia sp. lig30 TaxID=1192124 RepID=UPI001395CE63